MSHALRQLLDRLPAEAYADDERAHLASLIALLLRLPPPPDPCGLFPRYPALRAALQAALDRADPEAVDEALLTLYAHLHGHAAPYSEAERRRVDATGGYWCHAGGLSPVLRAPRHLASSSTSADLGAGNGLQLLLVQHLAPHARSVQIEISARMVEAGQALQAWLGIAPARVEWIVGDVTQIALPAVDLLYLYRPLRPEGPGRAFYQRLAAALDDSPRPCTVFSIADPLQPFVSARCQRFASDGHLTCYRCPGRAG